MTTANLITELGHSDKISAAVDEVLKECNMLKDMHHVFQSRRADAK